MVLKYSTNILEMNIGNKFYLYFDEVSFIFKQRGVSITDLWNYPITVE